jgi:tetratricopeptide (TPR) repeat protein
MGETALTSASPSALKGYRKLVSWANQVIRGSLAVPRSLLHHPRRTLVVATLLLLIAACAGIGGTYLWAAHHRRSAREALERYHTNEALSHLQACLSVWPRDPETLLLAARAARRTGEFSWADHYLDHYQKQRGEDNEELFIERVLVGAERGEVEPVSQFCQALVEKDHPATPLILEALARGYLRRARPRDAERVLNEWLKRQPDNLQAIFIRGQIHDEELRYHDAIADFRRVLAVDPEMDEACLRLCESLMHLGLSEEALPHLEYLSQRHPNNLKLQVYLARSHDRLGRLDKAEQILMDLLARHPDYGPALAERGKLALRAGRTIEAEKWLRQAILLEPGDVPAHYQLVLCLEMNGKLEEAEQARARLEQVEGDMRRVQDIAREKMQRTPHDPDLHYELGAIALRHGLDESGLRWLNRALEEKPDHVSTHKLLMEYYRRIGNFVRAAEHRRKAGIRSPDTSAPR